MAMGCTFMKILLKEDCMHAIGLKKKYAAVSIVKANLYCHESHYLDLTDPEIHLREVIRDLSKEGGNVLFNLVAKKILKLVLSDVERKKNTHFQLEKS